jgi:hypothetical protein
MPLLWQLLLRLAVCTKKKIPGIARDFFKRTVIFMKKRIALILAALLVFGMFGGCGSAEPAPATNEATQPKPTQTPEEAKVLKISHQVQ